MKSDQKFGKILDEIEKKIQDEKLEEIEEIFRENIRKIFEESGLEYNLNINILKNPRILWN